MAYNWDHPPYIREDKTRTGIKLNSANMSPELLHSMSKKIAQLTKVVYSLNTRVEDKDFLISSMKESHRKEIEQVVADSRDKLIEYKEKISQETVLKEKVGMLEIQLSEAKQLLEKKSSFESEESDELLLEKPNKLLCLTEKLEITKSDLQNTLKEFEMLHKNLQINLHNKSNCIDKYKNHQDEKTLSNGNTHSLKSLCDTLEKENILLIQKYEAQLNAIKTQYGLILIELEKLKSQSVNKTNGCKCNGTTNFIADLTNHETFFKKRLNELLLQLSDSEEQSERHQKEVFRLKDVIAKNDKQIEAMKEELSRLTSQLQQAANVNLCKSSIPFEDKATDKVGISIVNTSVEKNKENPIQENKEEVIKHLTSELNNEQMHETDEIHSKKSKKEEEGNCNERSSKATNEAKHNEEINDNCKVLQDESTKYAKGNSSKTSKESKKKHKETIKNLQADLKKQANHLNKLWREKMISKENELKEQFEKERRIAIDEVIVQKSMEYEKAEKDWQKTVNQLLKQISQLQSTLHGLEERIGNKEDNSQLDFEKEFIKLQIKQQENENLLQRKINSQESIFSQKLELRLKQQEEIFKERLEEIRKQHLAELDVQAEVHRSNLERLRLENECKKNEQKEKLQQLHQAHNALLQEKFQNQKSKALEEQEMIFLTEIKLMQSQLDAILEEMHLKEEAAFQKERQLKKELAVQKSKESKLHATIKILQNEIKTISGELELKRNEVLCVRNEATHQIRNLENYWQNRLIKEMKKVGHLHKEEKHTMLDNFLKAQDLLKDKIFVLKSRLQSGDYLSNHRTFPEDMEISKHQKIFFDNHSRFKLKDDKKAVSLEVLSQDRKPSTIDSTALFGIHKTVYERTVLKPLCSPLLLRRNIADSSDNRRHRSQNHNSAKLTLVPDKTGLRISDKRASWSGENIQNFDHLQEIQTGIHKENWKDGEKAISCIDLPTMCSNDIETSNSNLPPAKSRSQYLSNHTFDTIAECEEPLSITESAIKQSHFHVHQNNVSCFPKPEICHKLPLLESEL